MVEVVLVGLDDVLYHDEKVLVVQVTMSAQLGQLLKTDILSR